MSYVLRSAVMFLLLAIGASPALAAKYPTFGVGLNVGSEATYGNSISAFYRLYDYGELNWGFGVNSTGPKLGVGHTLIFNLTRAIGLTFGTSLIYSGGTDGEVEVEASFTPEGGTKEEDIAAVKSYELNPAGLLGLAAGGYWDYWKFLRLNAALCYNFAFVGNEVKLGDRMTYDKNVEITNAEQFAAEFDRAAKRDVRAGGLGFTMGAAFLF